MHDEILSNKQMELLPFIKKYKKKYFLVRGTAIAFHIGHRTSIDFDLFTFGKINSTSIKKQVWRLVLNPPYLFRCQIKYILY